MTSFSPVERSVARILAGFPGLRARLKHAYQHLNFLLHAERGFSVALHPDTSMQTPSQLIGADEPPAGTAEFFGYFDASPWSADGRFYAVNRATDPAQQTSIVVYDFEQRSRSVVAMTRAATWQQGAMPRWLKLSGRAWLAFNTMRAGVLGTQLHAAHDGADRFLDMPLQAVNDPCGKLYSINYLRLHRNRTEYGYAAQATNLAGNLPDDRDGIWSVDLGGGSPTLIISLAQLRDSSPHPQLAAALEHEVNHIAVSPDGLRFVFVHRFRGASGQFSRLYLAQHDGTQLQLLLDDGMVSHYAWLSATSLLAWARTRAAGDRYYLIDVDSKHVVPLPDDAANRWGDGHPSCHPLTGWIVSDSYADRRRQQHLFVMRQTPGQQTEIARFLLTLNFSGGDRVDLHPRWSPDGRLISVDAGHSGVRRNYILDVSRLLA